MGYNWYEDPVICTQPWEGVIDKDKKKQSTEGPWEPDISPAYLKHMSWV